MADGTVLGRPWHLLVVGTFSLIWNSGGAFDYTMTKTHNASYLSGLTPEQLAWVDSFPLWANIFWALGVWGAIAGSLLLLFSSRWAVPAFFISFLGLIGTTIFQFGVSDMPESLKTEGGLMFTGLLWVVAGFLLWYAARMRAKGVLG